MDGQPAAKPTQDWFVRVQYGYSEWLEGPFQHADEARDHVRLRAAQGRGAPDYDLRAIRLVSLEAEDVVQRLADWIEANCEGAQVYRDTGMVVT